jgi:UDP-2,4-diacetamido-2,4,6-trideoxy-beta-L-altropyranose hydrolase
MTALVLREAEAGDARLLFEWVNDPVVRAQSFTQTTIPWQDHERWFAKRLADARCLLLIAEDAQGRPVGQVRFDLDDDARAIISVAMAPEQRRRGYGAAAIAQACEALRTRHGALTVLAYIRQDNVASQRAFSRAGFSAPVALDYQGQAAVRQSLVLSARETPA